MLADPPSDPVPDPTPSADPTTEGADPPPQPAIDTELATAEADYAALSPEDQAAFDAAESLQAGSAGDCVTFARWFLSGWPPSTA